MKKALSIVVICALLLSALAVFASAAGSTDLPFEIVPPTNVAVWWIEENDSPTTMEFSLSLANDMTAFYAQLEAASSEGKADEFMSKYDYDEIWTIVQIDWAIDDVNDSVSGWHYNEFWTQRGEVPIRYDKDWNIRTSEWDGAEIGLNNATETTQSYWIMRGVPDDERWNGNPDTKTPGVKDQLRPDQYTYYDDTVHIDFTQHTAYFRARLVTVTRKAADGIEDSYYYSDWSKTVGYGKDVVKLEPLKEGDVEAPVITGLRMTDKTFNDNPVVAFTLTVPDKLQEQSTIAAVFHGSIRIFTECRVKGDTEWTQMGNTDFEIKSGEMECALLHLVNDERPNIPKDTIIELRCHYCISQDGYDDFYSPYSKIISFGTDDINAGETSYVDGSAPETSEGPGGSAKDECWLCHFCPQPLGLCIFIWLLILIIAIIIIFVIVKKAKKNGENKK